MTPNSKKKMILILTSEDQSLEVATNLKTLLQTAENRVFRISNIVQNLSTVILGIKYTEGNIIQKKSHL